MARKNTYHTPGGEKPCGTLAHMLGRACLVFVVGGAMVACTGLHSGNYVADDGSLHGRVSLSGAFALYPLAVRWAEAFKSENPGVRIEIEAGGAGKGITDVLTGQVDFGMLSRDLNEAELEKGAVPFVVAKDAVVPTVSEKNPHIEQLLRHGISRETARKIFVTSEVMSWGQVLGHDGGDRIHVFTRSDACGAAETWAAWFEVGQDELKGDALNGDPSIASAVASDHLAIGYNNMGYVYDSKTGKPAAGIKVLSIDVNGDGQIDPAEDFYASVSDLSSAISQGKYPTPPARNLYLVSRGEPSDPVVSAFLSYVLTRGQALNHEAGYVAVTPDSASRH